MAGRGRAQFWRPAQGAYAECRRACDSAACYRPHAHETLSLGAVDRGASDFSLAGDRRRLQAGDVVLIPRDEVHACNPLPGQAWSYQMLYLDEAWLRGVLDEMNPVPPGWTPRLPTSVSPGALHRRLSCLTATLLGTADEAEKETALLLFAGRVFAADFSARIASARIASAHFAPLETGGASPLRQRMYALRALIAERCAESLPLSWLAEQAGLSRYHFVRAFRDVVGMTPHAWQTDRRIVRARALLAEGAPLADLAQQLGFADQSHFQRAFKARIAATPGAYRRALAGRRRAQ